MRYSVHGGSDNIIISHGRDTGRHVMCLFSIISVTVNTSVSAIQYPVQHRRDTLH